MKSCFTLSSFCHSEENHLKTHQEKMYIVLIFFDKFNLSLPQRPYKFRVKENTQLIVFSINLCKVYFIIPYLCYTFT